MFPFAALLAIAPVAAFGGNVVTNATELMSYLGFGGKEGVEFALDAKVVWGTSTFSKGFCAKADDGFIELVDKALWPGTLLSEGDLIKVRGTTVGLTNNIANGFVNANCLAVDVIGHIKPELPVDATIDDVLAERERHLLYYVRVQGTVRDVFTDEIDHRYWYVIMSSGEKSMGISLPAETYDMDSLSRLIGAEIRVTGCCSHKTSGFRRLCKCEINLHSTNDIEVVSPPPEDPFAVAPLVLISLDNPASIMSRGRCSARGVVIAVWQQFNFAIRTEAGTVVNISLADGPPPTCGDAVEVAGLPDTDLYRINLRRAIWRKMPGAERSVPEKATPTDAAALFTDGKGHDEINPSFHGKAISLRGIVTGLPSAGSDDGILRLQCGGFAVTVDAGATPCAIEGLEIGCEAEISGTCIVKTDSWHPNEPLPRIRDVMLVVRVPSDVKILVPPPWWTPGKLFVLVITLVAIIAAFVLWNVLLRRLADKRGRELMQTRLAQEESKLKVQERTRIAVELHDTIAQNLTGVSLEIDSAGQLAAKDTAGMMKHLDMAARTLQSCRNELRNCLWDLRSRALEEADLNEAIRRTIAPLVSEVELSIRFNVPRKSLADDTAHVLMRILRELVLNAVRHGGASTVKIAGSLEDGTLRFSVRDNGRGFDPATRPGVMQGHFGLQGIRERVNQFNGEMAIESSPGNGAKVSISMKL